MVGDRKAPKVKHASLMVSSRILPRWMSRPIHGISREERIRNCVYATIRFIIQRLESEDARRDARSGAWTPVARTSDAPALRRNRRRTVEDHKVPNPAFPCVRLSQTTECKLISPRQRYPVGVKRRRIGR